MGSEFFGSHRRLRTPSNTFWTFTVRVSEPIQVFHSREYLALLIITRHNFLNEMFPCTHTHEMRCFPCICNVMHHCMSMSCHICDECHMDNLIHTFYHVSWIIILHAYNLQNKHSFQCQYISTHISTFIKQQLTKPCYYKIK